MTGSILSAVTIISSLLLALLKAWGDGAPKRKEKAREKEIQAGRTAIDGGNAGAVSQRIDRVLTVQEAGGAGSAAKLGSDEDTARRLAEVTGG